MRALRFERVAGMASVLVGIGGLAYAALFVWIVAGSPSWVLKAWFALLLGSQSDTVQVAAAPAGCGATVPPRSSRVRRCAR